MNKEDRILLISFLEAELHRLRKLMHLRRNLTGIRRDALVGTASLDIDWITRVLTELKEGGSL